MHKIAPNLQVIGLNYVLEGKPPKLPFKLTTTLWSVTNGKIQTWLCGNWESAARLMIDVPNTFKTLEEARAYAKEITKV